MVWVGQYLYTSSRGSLWMYNADDLMEIDGRYVLPAVARWSATGESGNPLIGAPGTGLFGDLTAGALESSNVDMTQQLVGLMEGQRNYQANSKVLSTNKELTQVLFNSI